MEWKDWARSSDLCLLDGTFWDENELISAGVGPKTAREIGHVPLSGADGLLAQFGIARRGRRVLIHINNTNPILDEESPESREVRDAGWEIAYDGMSSNCDFDMRDTLLSESEFIAGFHAIGEERYHHKHPFHLLMHEGKLTRGQLQSWALNRYYYQSRIPIKDAAILARSRRSGFPARLAQTHHRSRW